MTAPIPNVPQLITDFVLPGSAGGALRDPVPFFTMPLGIPGRIDSVYLELNYTPVPHVAGDTYGLWVVQQGGTTQAQVWTPAFDQGDQSSDVTYLTLTWMRGGNGLDQLGAPGATVAMVGMATVCYFTGTYALPDTVLQPEATLQIQRSSITSSGDVMVTGGVVTYTPNAGPVSTTSSAQDILPLLVPTTG